MIDFGTDSSESTDYPDYALAVAEEVASGNAARGDSGLLHRHRYVDRGEQDARHSRRGRHQRRGRGLTRSHNDANVLALGAKFLGSDEASRLVDIFLTTDFDGGPRHARRIGKIAAMERNAHRGASNKSMSEHTHDGAQSGRSRSAGLRGDPRGVGAAGYAGWN